MGKKKRYIIIAIISMLFICIYTNHKLHELSDYNNDYEQEADITWVRNEDGSYTFTNNSGSEESIYAWYVLGENEEPIYKTKYSESPNFVYDLKENRDLIIKGFIRTGTQENFDQISIKVSASDVLGPITYEIISTDAPENLISLLKRQILRSDQGIPVESILAKDGSAWQIDLAIPVDWNCPNISNRSFGFQTNGLIFLDDTYKAYCDTHDITYANIIKDYVVDWSTQNTEYNDFNEWIWHDDATASRVTRMTLYYCEFKEIFSKKEQKQVEESLRYQAKLLSTKEFYTEKHNHGMHQDKALLLYALLLGNNTEKKHYISTALERLGAYFDYIYTNDGIHKEHSPFYARDSLTDMIFFKEVIKDISPEFADHIDQYINNAQDYLIQVIKPDGMWPSIGDSSPFSGIEAAETILENNSQYLWITSQKKIGTPPPISTFFRKADMLSLGLHGKIRQIRQPG